MENNSTSNERPGDVGVKALDTRSRLVGVYNGLVVRFGVIGEVAQIERRTCGSLSHWQCLVVRVISGDIHPAYRALKVESIIKTSLGSSWIQTPQGRVKDGTRK